RRRPVPAPRPRRPDDCAEPRADTLRAGERAASERLTVQAEENVVGVVVGPVAVEAGGQGDAWLRSQPPLDDVVHVDRILARMSRIAYVQWSRQNPPVGAKNCNFAEWLPGTSALVRLV